MSRFLHEYILIGATGLIAIIFSFAMLYVGKFLRPASTEISRKTTYESGSETHSSFRGKNYVRYYLLALLFLIFDIEIAFLIPWVLNIEEFGLVGILELFSFIGILLLGLAYAWKKRMLDWE